MMKNTLPFGLMMAVWAWTSTGSVNASEQVAADFFVSPTGDDTWSGTLAEKNAEATDGPFATFARAQRAVRELMRSERKQPVLVLFRGGTYELTEPITLKPANSGTASAPVTYAAYPGEQPIFSGGKSIGTGWTKNDDGTWTTLAEKAKHYDWAFSQLFVNGKRAVRARTPNRGFLHTKGIIPGMDPHKEHRYDNRSRQGFRFKPGDIERWLRLEDANVTVYHSWTTSRHWIASLDLEKYIVTFTNRSDWPIGFWEETDQRYFVENVREALDAPGEWYLDRWTGHVTYMPRENEDIATAVFVAPKLHQLVIIDGDPVNGDYVQYIALKGLSFQHASWEIDRATCVTSQGMAGLASAITADGARHIEFEDCEIAHVGEYAIHFNRGCSRNRIVNCHVHDLGAGGVRIGVTKRMPASYELSEHNVVENCLIHDGGHVFQGGIGVLIGNASYTRVAHNDIFDFDYTGISVGWEWSRRDYTFADYNIIECNRIHNIGRGQLSDMAGIYTLGRAPHSCLRYNLIHDVQGNLYGGNGLYNDAYSHGYLMEQNIVYRCSDTAYHLSRGTANVLRNNILAFGGRAEVTTSNRDDPPPTITAERNIIYTKLPRMHAFEMMWTAKNYALDYNLYYRAGGESFDWPGDRTFEQWKEWTGQDKNSIIADPLFVDPENGDFTLKPGSPAEKIGFVPIDTSLIGRRRNSDKK